MKVKAGVDFVENLVLESIDFRVATIRGSAAGTCRSQTTYQAIFDNGKISIKSLRDVEGGGRRVMVHNAPKLL
jgi:hypothetical protein